MSSTAGSAGAIGATVAGTVAATVVCGASATGTAAAAATGAMAVSGVTTGTVGSTASAVTIAPCAGASATPAGLAAPVGNVIVPTGEGSWLTTGVETGADGVTPPADDAPSGARAIGVVVTPTAGVVGVGSAAELARSAAPKAAVMPRIAVAESPVERMRAERATWRSRGTRAPGRSVVVIVVLTFVFTFVFAIVFALVVIVIVIVMRWARRIEISARWRTDGRHDLAVH